MMGYLFLGLTVLSTAWILVGLRELKRFNLNVLQAITFNYIFATLFGAMRSPNFVEDVTAEPGAFALSAYLGVSFIALFFLMAMVAQKVGVAYMTVVTKMSLVLPAIFSWLYYQDAMDALKGLGILLALGSVFLINYRPEAPVQLGNAEKGNNKLFNLVLILGLFLGSGLNDICFRVFNAEFADTVSNINFPVVIFGIAGIIGAVIAIWQIASGRVRFQWQTLIAGIVIGVPNYFSIVFLVKSLDYFNGTVFFPVNNTALLILTGLIGIFVYREAMNKWNLMGLGLAVVAVLLLF